jgi:two-component system, cell cycle sensor histidine kinase and response regulator CckA
VPPTTPKDLHESLGAIVFDAVETTDGPLMRWVSPNMTARYGYSPEAACQPGFLRRVIHPDDLPGMVATIQSLSTDGFRQHEHRVIDAQGAEHWVIADVRYVAPEAPGLAGRYIGVWTDVTARHAADALHRLKSAAVDAAADAIVITDTSGAILWANPAFSSLSGYAAEEVPGRSLRELVNAGMQDRAFYRQLWDTITSGEVWRGELVNRRKDGSTYPEAQSITPVRDASGRIAHFIAIKRDITAAKQLTDQLMQAQRMESVGRLAGGVAHDFNNQLTVINGMLDLVLAGLPEDGDVAADLREARAAGTRAGALTRQLLAFSRQQVMRREVAEVSGLVRELTKMLGRLLGEDVRLDLQLAEGLPSVLVDLGQLEQVLLNLAVNARDAMPRGGQLTIATLTVDHPEEVPVVHGSLPAGRYVVLRVRDSGVGMSPEVRDHIFEPFFTTKEFGKGTGLGLAMVHGIIAQFGGGIIVDSAPGAGTTFDILLPATTRTSAPVPMVPPGAEAPTRQRTILLVDDEPALRLVGAKILSRAGYVVLAAASGEEALQLLSTHEGAVDLLLTDVVMPGMGGSDLAAAVRSRYPSTKVLFTSGYTDDTIVRHGIDDNEVAFLPKPYNIEQLTGRVREVLAGSPAAPASGA